MYTLAELYFGERFFRIPRDFCFFLSSPRRRLPLIPEGPPWCVRTPHFVEFGRPQRTPPRSREYKRGAPTSFLPPITGQEPPGAPQRRPGAAKKRPQEPREAQKRRRGVKKWSQRGSKGSPERGQMTPKAIRGKNDVRNPFRIALTPQPFATSEKTMHLV